MKDVLYINIHRLMYMFVLYLFYYVLLTFILNMIRPCSAVYRENYIYNIHCIYRKGLVLIYVKNKYFSLKKKTLFKSPSDAIKYVPANNIKTSFIKTISVLQLHKALTLHFEETRQYVNVHLTYIYSYSYSMYIQYLYMLKLISYKRTYAYSYHTHLFIYYISSYI